MIHGFDDSTKEKAEVIAKSDIITISKTQDVAKEAFTIIRFDNVELATLGVNTDNLADYIIDAMYMRTAGPGRWYDLGSEDYQLQVDTSNKYIQIVIDNSTSGAFTIKIRLRLIKVA